jgi:hypothetical protein
VGPPPPLKREEKSAGKKGTREKGEREKEEEETGTYFSLIS